MQKIQLHQGFLLRKSFEGHDEGHVLLLGPVFPWRGGIAHHTNQLANTLTESGEDISVISFSYQYPSFLYPGKAQKEPGDTKNPLKTPVKYILNTINPLSWLSTAHEIVNQKSTTLIIKYWHPFFVPCFTFITWYTRRKGTKNVCIIENLLPYERKFGDTWLVKMLFSQIDQVVTQSPIVHEQCIKLFPKMPEMMIPHPVYDQFGPPVQREEACEKLHLPKEKTLLLFFGFIRHYKGLEMLLEILPKLIEQKPDLHLVIAGECFGSFENYQEIIDKHHLSVYITQRQEYIPNSEIPAYFGACDLLVMPYRHMTNSGIENIGHIYASRSLLTVGATTEELKNRILEALDKEPNREKRGMSWEEYKWKLEKILN